MAWDDDMPSILRGLIQDYSVPPTYSDSRLMTQILITVPILLLRVAFSKPYVADINNETLRPDPTTTPKDSQFISLCCLMAALNLINAEVRDMTRQGIEIQDGDSRIKLGRDSASLRLMVANYSTMFEDALYSYKTGGDAGLGEIITGPYQYSYGATGNYFGHRGDDYGGIY